MLQAHVRRAGEVAVVEMDSLEGWKAGRLEVEKRLGTGKEPMDRIVL